MNKPSVWPLIVFLGLCVGTSARGDSITGGPNGTVVISTNDGSVTATGVFTNSPTISGGKGNIIGVQATGAAVSIQILKDVPDPTVPTNDSTITVSSVTATNTGNVTATGTFNGGSIGGNGSSNGMSVSAAGTSVNISIIKR